MTQSIELIAIDLDGTLLDPNHKMTERVEKALKAAMEKGVKVVIATGKTRYSAEDVIARLNLNTPGIYLQGLAVYQADGNISHQWTLDPMVARQVITFAEDRGFDMIVYSGSRLLVRSENNAVRTLTEKYDEPVAEAVGPLVNILDDVPVHKVMAVKLGESKRITALRWQLGMQLDGKGRLVQAMLKDMVEILPPNGSKGTALKAVLKDMGITADKVLAIGDGENDIEMLEMAGIGVAMGNADPRLKAIADHVTRTNAEDGVAEAVDRYVLGGTLETLIAEKVAEEAEAEATTNTQEITESSEVTES